MQNGKIILFYNFLRKCLYFSWYLTKTYVFFPDFYLKKVMFSPEVSWK